MDSKQLAELIGQYGVQVATTGELAPTKELADALASLQPAQEPVADVIAQKIMDDLDDRSGILDGVDDDIRADMYSTIRAIVLASPLPQSALSQAAKETDLSRRLRLLADRALPFAGLTLRTDEVTEVAAEIERYYGGMLAWKATAEAKDKDLAALSTDAQKVQNFANFEKLFHTLEIIAVGDSGDPVQASRDTLVEVGLWDRALQSQSLPSSDAESQPASAGKGNGNG